MPTEGNNHITDQKQAAFHAARGFHGEVLLHGLTDPFAPFLSLSALAAETELQGLDDRTPGDFPIKKALETQFRLDWEFVVWLREALPLFATAEQSESGGYSQLKAIAVYEKLRELYEISEEGSKAEYLPVSSELKHSFFLHLATLLHTVLNRVDAPEEESFALINFYALLVAQSTPKKVA